MDWKSVREPRDEHIRMHCFFVGRGSARRVMDSASRDCDWHPHGTASRYQ